MSFRLKTGDTVKVIAGDHKGKSAKILRVDRQAGKVFLEGIGEGTRHFRASAFRPAGKKKIHLGIDASNVKLESAKKEQK